MQHRQTQRRGERKREAIHICFTCPRHLVQGRSVIIRDELLLTRPTGTRNNCRRRRINKDSVASMYIGPLLCTSHALTSAHHLCRAINTVKNIQGCNFGDWLPVVIINMCAPRRSSSFSAKTRCVFNLEVSRHSRRGRNHAMLDENGRCFIRHQHLRCTPIGVSPIVVTVPR